MGVKGEKEAVTEELGRGRQEWRRKIKGTIVHLLLIYGKEVKDM